MRIKRRHRIPITLPARLTRAGLLFSALTAVAACQLGGQTSSSDDIIVRPPRSTTQSFVRRPVQRLLFTAKPTASPEEIEKYFKTNLMPALAADDRIGNVAVYVDGTGAYFVQAELRTLSPANPSLAYEIFSVGRKPEEAEAMLASFAKYFDIANTRQLTPRADLSVSRQVLGTIATETPPRPVRGVVADEERSRPLLDAVKGGAQ